MKRRHNKPKQQQQQQQRRQQQQQQQQQEEEEQEQQQRQQQYEDNGLLNEYHILEKIATGSFGVIFKVSRTLDNGIFVMKRINLSGFDEKQRREAAQEVRVMDQLHHPFVVEQRDAFLFDDNSLCIVMDYYDGGDLDTLIARQRERDEYLSLERTMMWFVSICLAVQYLHAQKIVHRDLKTHNIFLDLRSLYVAIGDFGVAEFMDTSAVSAPDGGGTLASRRTSPISQQLLAKRRETEQQPRDVDEGDSGRTNGFICAAVRGTLLYMAPEAMEGSVCDPSSDVWSLGCILYELLSLRHPFESRDVAGLMVRVMMGLRQPLPAHYPPEVAQLVDRMLARDAAKRPSCEEILRSPFVGVYLHELFLRRVPRDAPDSAAERTLVAQLQMLGVSKDAIVHQMPLPQERCPMMPPSKERAAADGRTAAALAAASPRSGLRLSPGTSTFDDESFLSRAPMPSLHLCRGEGGSSFNTCHDNSLHPDVAGDTGMRFSRHGPLRDAGNVEDMRHKTLACIEDEVMRYRQLVQSEMRAQKQERDAAMLKRRFGGSPTSPASAHEPRHHYNRRAHSEQPRHAQTPQAGILKPRPLHVQGHECSSCEGEESQTRPSSSFEMSLLRRRRQSIDEAVQVLGGTVFFVVYNYYKNVDVPDRDPAWVMHLVPDRTRWFVLPVVEEVVVVDRLLERAVAADPS